MVVFAVMFAFHASKTGLEQFCVVRDKREQWAETTGGRSAIHARAEESTAARGETVPAGFFRGLLAQMRNKQTQTSQIKWLF